ncbi:MAG TPA: histidine kinase [Nocardioidaceae bacterium]|nr:histidine kinase [Nocardioidaceae bacterium]
MTTTERGERSALAAILLGSTALIAVATVLLDIRAVATGIDRGDLELGWSSLLPGLAMVVPGALLLGRMPRHAVAWVLTIGGLFWALNGLAATWLVNATAVDPPWPGASLAFFLFVRAGAWLLLILPLLLVLFPDGRLPSGWWGRAALASLASTALLPLSLMFVPSDVAERQTGDSLGPQLAGVDVDPLSIPLPAGVWTTILTAAYLLVPISQLVPLAIVIRRYRAASGVGRLQLRWLLWAAVMDAVIVLLGFTVLDAAGGALLIVAVALTAGAIVVAITQYRLYDVDLLLRETLAYSGLVVGVVVMDLLVLAVAGSVLDERESALVALVVVTLVYAPLRARGWEWARRWLRGDRDDPYAVLATVASALERTDDADDQMLTVVRTIRSAFRSPYARCEIVQPGGERLVVEDGRPGPSTVRLPISYRDEEVGSLELAPSRTARLNARDQALLGDVLRQTAAATRATRLARELQASREALVVAREEERRRLRRDLHDGLGPSLAAVSLQIQTARNLAASEPARADGLLVEATEQVSAVVQDVRRLVHDLRPPALDELGLVGAVDQLARRLHGADNGLRVEVRGDHDLAVPAAVEVAAYRIVSEALANVVRHSGASTCAVVLDRIDDARGRWLRVDVVDDGGGVPDDAVAGVGLASLRERAGELGGRVRVESADGPGTRVRAWLPMLTDDNEEGVVLDAGASR